MAENISLAAVEYSLSCRLMDFKVWIILTKFFKTFANLIG